MDGTEFEKIISSASQGDMMAMETILRIYEPLINSYAYINGRVDEDLKQELMIKILKKLPQFKR